MSEKLTAESYASDWLNEKYRGAKELGDWTPQDVFQFAEDFANARASAWIPVSERLPEASQKVLVSFIDKKGLDGTYTAKWFDGEFWLDGDTHNALGVKIIAWQPLPEPVSRNYDRLEMRS